MNHKLIFPIFFYIFLASTTWGQEKPVSYSLDRYTVIWKKSMFARSLESRKSIPNSSVYWTLAGVFSYEGGIGAMIVNQSTGAVEQVEMGKPNKSGLMMIDLIQDEASGAASVKIDQSGKTFWVSKLPTPKPPPVFTAERLALQKAGDDSLRKAVAAQ